MVDARRHSRATAQVAEGVAQHHVALLGSTVNVTIEISAEIPGGVPDAVVRTVTENCRTLRFTTYQFEEH